MAREEIVISIKTLGAGTASKQIRGVGTAAQGATKYLKLMNVAIAAMVGSQILRGLIGLADAYTTIQNRIRVLIDDQRLLGTVTNELFEISQATRTSFQGTADVYARTALAAKDLGISQREVLDFTKSLNQAVVIGGSTAQEATNAMIQLSQGLASGALRGDELRSVLEQLPVVADVIAKELNVTRGELREMGQDGKITADIILTAFKNAREELEERFGKTVPTIAQGFEVLRNSVVKAVGEWATASGAAEGLARILITLSENMDKIVRIVATAAIVFGLWAGKAAIGLAIAQLRILFALVSNNPFGIMIKLIFLAVAAIAAFGDGVRLAGSNMVTFRDLAVATMEHIVIFLNFVAETSNKVFGGMESDSSSAFQGMTDFLGSLIQAFATGFDFLVGIISGFIVTVIVGWDKFAVAMVNTWNSIMDSIAQKWRDFLNFFIKGWNSVVTTFGGESVDLFDDVIPAPQEVEQYGGTLGNAFMTGFNASTQATDALDSIAERSREIAAERVISAHENAKLATEMEELLNRVGEDKTSATGGDAAGKAKAVADEISRLDDLYKEITGDLAGFAQKQMDLNTLFEAGRISAEQYAAAMRDLNVEVSALDNSFSGGLQNGIDRMIQRSNELGSTVSDVVVGAFDKLTDTFINFAKTGEFAWKDLMSSIFESLFKLAMNQIFAQLLGGLGGGAGGGILGSLLGMATGGTIMPTGSGSSDSQVVAFKKRPDERVDVLTPDQQANQARNGGGGGGGGVTNVTTNVAAVLSESDIARAMDTSEGETTIINVLQRNATTVRQIAGAA